MVEQETLAKWAQEWCDYLNRNFEGDLQYVDFTGKLWNLWTCFEDIPQVELRAPSEGWLEGP